MKLAKRMMAAILTMVLALGLVSTALAAQEGKLTGGKITITNAESGQTYNAYQILYLESYSVDGEGNATGAYSYKANSAWADWLATQKDFVSIDEQGYVTWVQNASVVTFAKLAQEHAVGLDADKTATATGEAVVLEDLKLGYYLVDTTLGTLCSLDTTNPVAVMEEKNEAPSVTKEVQEDSTSAWGETNDADINQTVIFKATITVQAGAENYVLHDVMSEGLTYVDVQSVKIGETDVPAEEYEVTTPGTETSTEGKAVEVCTFEVAFDDDYIAGLEAGTQIVVEYTAILNEKAVVGLDGNTNKVRLQYGDENHPTYTPFDETITYTWDAKVVKYTKQNGQEVVLADATFKICTDNAGENALKFHVLGENKYEHCAKDGCPVEKHVTEITTDATGTFAIEGLDTATYYLHETVAPAGYNKLAAPVEIAIVGLTPKSETDNTLEYKTVETKVENMAGAILPETGGIGTTIFYVVGAALVLGAVVLLVTKMRMGTKK